MNVTLLKRKRKAKDLEKFYNRFLVRFADQLKSLEVNEMYNSGLGQFNAILNDAEKQLRKEQKRLRKKGWYKDMQKGKFLPKRYAIARKYVGKKLPLFLKWTDTQFSRAENFASGNASKVRLWAKINYPKLKVLTDERERWIQSNLPKVERFAVDRYTKGKDFVIQRTYQIRKMAS